LLAGGSLQVIKVKNLRYSTAARSNNQNGPRLWSKTQPQRVAPGNTGVLRLVLRTAAIRFHELLVVVSRCAQMLLAPDCRHD
jgi:hypothetical protein